MLVASNTVSALKVDGVSFRYASTDETTALNQVSFDLPSGGRLAVLGPNGSGKSTLFKILSTQVKASAGNVKVFGVDVDSEPATARQLIGICFQSPSLDAVLTVRENLQVHESLYSGVVRGTSLDFARKLGLEPLLDRRAGQLSGGESRRVELCKSLASGARLLILDEPTAGLDPKARSDFWSLLWDEQKTKRFSVCLVTHLVEEAEQCEELVFLSRGELRHRVSLKEVHASVAKAKLEVQMIQKSGFIDPRWKQDPMRSDWFVCTGLGAAEWPQVMAQLPSDLVKQIKFSKLSIADLFFESTGEALESI